MPLTVYDRIGNWNPQLLRELKSRLNSSSFLIAITISIVVQLLVSIYFRNKLFLYIGLVDIWLLIVAGTYLIVRDLAIEKNNGTLEFIRFSPQSPQKIIIGKILGVPIVIYGIVIFTLPFHLWAGIASQISLSRILIFYGFLVVSCFLFYSASILYALVGCWLNGIQPWLFGGIISLWIWLSLIYSNRNYRFQVLFSPTNIFDLTFSDESLALPDTIFFYLMGIVVFNYAFWTYWIWQALKRSFPNPRATLLTKKQSYVLAVCFGVLRFVFTDDVSDNDWGEYIYGVLDSSLAQLSLFLFLIVALSPHRQALLDWVRFSQQRLTRKKGLWNRTLVHDLLWDERSPALVTIAINLLITVPCIVPWISSWNEYYFKDFQQVMWVVLPLEAGLILIFAVIAQLMLLTATRRPAFLSLCIPGVIIFWIVIAYCLMWHYDYIFLFLFLLFCELCVLILLVRQLRRQLQRQLESLTRN